MYYITTNSLEHHGVPGQKWGVRNGPPYPLSRSKRNKSLNNLISSEQASKKQSKSLKEIENDSLTIKKEVDKYSDGGPAGNQNCQLCTWAMESRFRGLDVLPRPVYSPRDKVLSMNGYDIVKNPEKMQIKNKSDVADIVKKAGEDSRFYTHVNWKDSSGGHEFLVINKDGDPYILDAQDGLLTPINSKKASEYFDDINYANSFLVRMDDKKLNKDILKYNDPKYIVKWDDKKDIEFMMRNNMLSTADEEYLKTMKHSAFSANNSFVILERSQISKWHL